MSNSKTVLKGIVHGKTIQLKDDLGLPDGQEVRVTVQPVSQPREGSLERALGARADDAPEVDRYLEWNRQQRTIGRPEIEP